MEKEAISIQHINGFSSVLLDYLSNKAELKSFYQLPPAIESFEQQIKLKANFSKKNRAILVNVLKQQYEGIAERLAISWLADEKTFTVTTGHQLNLFTGPLYVIYKIVSTINLARELKQRHPEYQFVPIYWLASEDHDFEEINHFYWNQTKHEWHTSQKGAVGRFSVKDLEPLYRLFPDSVGFFKEAYGQSKTLAEAVIRYMDYLFGQEGLICLDADHKDLKSLFTRVMEKDILEQAHEPLVQKSTVSLQKLGYKTQVNARPVNFFYLDEQLRERIEQKGEQYIVAEAGLSFNAEQMAEAIKQQPERFSPNVILRPLYQETILPNLAYIGGPAEVVYWLQLKAVFDLHEVPFPILLPRNFATILRKRQVEKCKRIGLNFEELFDTPEDLKRRVLELFGSSKHDISEQGSRLQAIYLELESIAHAIDKSLVQSVRSHLQVSKQAFDRIQLKFVRAELRNHGEQLAQISRLQEQLFPGGTWQERKDSFLNYYTENPGFLKQLLEQLHPLAFDMNFLIVEDGREA